MASTSDAPVGFEEDSAPRGLLCMNKSVLMNVEWSRNVLSLQAIHFAQYLVSCGVMLFRHNEVGMELRHLRYFLAVAETLSFTKAAAELRVAQPALSRQVRDLEEELGVQLLNRSPRGATLTPEGRVFLDDVRTLLKLSHEAVERVRSFSRGQSGELHIGYAPSPTVEILPRSLDAFQREFPDLSVLLHDASRRELLEGLNVGKFEIAVMPEVVAPGIVFQAICSYPFCVAVPPNHPFSRLRTVRWEKLAQQPLVGFSKWEYPDYHALLEGVFLSIGLKPNFVLECDSASTLITAVESGRGIAITLPIMRFASGKRLTYRPIAGIKEKVSVGIAWAASRKLTLAAEGFIRLSNQASS